MRTTKNPASDIEAGFFFWGSAFVAAFRSLAFVAVAIAARRFE
jgi:hypothetical protein